MAASFSYFFSAIAAVICLSTLLLLVDKAAAGAARPRAAIADTIIQRTEIINENYTVSWEANLNNQTITFNVLAKTTGFVGFGLSPAGGMTGADIFIGGVGDNGTYHKDYHAVGQSTPIEDESQDWTLSFANQNGTHTELTFSRKFDTCDEDDVAITEDSTHFIWSYGETDTIGYHGTSRGSVPVNILDPPMPALDLTNFQKWDLTVEMEMPEKDTSYWCTVHRRPAFGNTTHHIVAFDAFLPSPEALKHSHHILVTQCIPPAGEDPDVLFGKFVDGYGGHECYQNEPEEMGYCRTFLYVWALGGKTTLFPEDVGYPINEQHDLQNEYIKLEIHYDNPGKLKGVRFETGITVYHTPELRTHEAAMLLVDHDLFPTHLIPPKTADFTIVGHCSPNCTGDRIPETGIKLFNVMQHSHLAGRKLRLRHFRNGVELPWIANDEHYNFDFQQNRPLREERIILPGDQITYECTTDTSERNYTTLAGLSTRHEMCEAFIWYYPRINFAGCGSLYYEFDKIMEQFGVEDLTWDFDNFDPTVTAPLQHANKTFSDVLNEYNWTSADVSALQEDLRHSKHYSTCRGQFDPPEENLLNLKKSTYAKYLLEMSKKVRQQQIMDEFEDKLITYPDVEPYAPERETCGGISSTTPDGGGGGGSSSLYGGSNSIPMILSSIIMVFFKVYLS